MKTAFDKRKYQEDAVQALFELWDAGQKPLLVSPAGSGKTVILAKAVKEIVEVRDHMACVLVLVHTESILKQTRDTFLACGIDPELIGILKAGVEGDAVAQIQIASVQTMSRRKVRPASGYVLFDEAHHIASCSWAAIAKDYPRARLAGFTATPERLDGKSLKEFYSTLYEVAKKSELEREGRLVPPEVFTWEKGVSLDGVRSVRGDYNNGELSKAMNRPNLIGDAVDHYKRRAKGKRAVVFCVSILHAEATVAAFVAGGVKAEIAHGGMNTRARDKLLGAGGRLSKGETKVVVTCQLVSEGWDLPKLECVVMMRPTKSRSLFEQQVGRGARAWGKKTSYTVLDHAGNYRRLDVGLGVDPVYSLEEGYENRGDGKCPTKVCRTSWCGMLLPISVQVCPTCGFEFDMRTKEMIVAEGELVRMRAAAEADMEVCIARIIWAGIPPEEAKAEAARVIAGRYAGYV